MLASVHLFSHEKTKEMCVFAAIVKKSDKTKGCCFPLHIQRNKCVDFRSLHVVLVHQSRTPVLVLPQMIIMPFSLQILHLLILDGD